MNPVERVTVPSSDLEEGYYVVGVRARTLTESDVQAYGLAAAGGGLVLHGMSKNWADLVLETDSTHGTGVGTEEPDPDGEGNGATPAPSVLVAEGSADGGGGVTPTGDSIINAPTSAPVETATGSTSGSGTSMAGDEDGFSGDSTGSGAGVSHLGGGDDDISAAGGIETDVPEGGDLDVDGGGSGGTTITTIAASSAAAALLIGAGICLAVRRNKLRSSGRPDETGSFLCPVRNGSSSAGR
ncbi:unnamed protein product, partial [Ectocarpus sp. 8 AP-2014]